jgi:hypothetical protein
VIFAAYADRNELIESELEDARQQFFSKGQACMRASPLTKRYGWGVHNNAEGKIAIYGLGTEEYEKFTTAEGVKVVRGMRSKRSNIRLTLENVSN